ncbi:hypothetical protein M422DRAFT_36550 [Sphaerobolus stellatus SS14]|uniref:Unplaced genomic scaffold SPHSTscaffold_186, whole genome shotgun sequence n=1 Tax=Sphaerobolus stellatus (strain SS14) TaxID=990650 RepID=A0A0C9UNP3_SPHS4|nr:hypothetical protein M422DRAFT_36550 [Sphaerobolus stellatus SS14]
MSNLPSQLPRNLQEFAHAVSAYNSCLHLESTIQTDIDGMHDVNQSRRSMIYCRILGYFLIYAPSDQARRTIELEIVSCKNKRDALLELGELYYGHFILAFRSNKGKTPTPSNLSSRASYDTIAEMTKDLLEEAPQNHSSAKKRALVRDGFRCPVTGRVDEDYVLKNHELYQKVTREKLRTAYTQCAHIISEFISSGITEGSDKSQCAATVWAILKRFGYPTLLDELSGSKVHRLENVITMEFNLRQRFDNLRIWFTPTDHVNQYKLEARYPFLLTGYSPLVTFTTPDERNLPVPNPAYLALHASCAKVAHLSGAAEYIDQVFSDMEETRVLSADGASADVLEHAIFYASSRPFRSEEYLYPVMD